MKRFMLFLCIVLIPFIFTSCNANKHESPEAVKQDIGQKIQGAWTLENMDVGIGENRRTREDAQFMIFIMKNHYSAIRDLTEASITAQRSFMADAGTYELDGKEMVVHHKLAMFPVLGTMTFKCFMEGENTLILEPQYDKMVMPGMEGIRPSSDGQMGYGDMAVRYVFKRLE